MDSDALTRAVGLVRARGARAQLCVLRDGRVVVDRAYGCAPTALFWIFSTSKPFVAMLVWLLAERGTVLLDERVAAYWPEFARNGKGAVTIRQVLAHRSGLPAASLLDALAITNWRRSIHRLERARLVRPPGAAPAYQAIGYGFLLGELVRRVTGGPVAELLDSELLTPLQLHDTYLGLPRDVLQRRVAIRGRGAAARDTALAVNSTHVRRAIIPSAGISTTARDLARFYQMLLSGGELDGVRVLQPTTIERARQPSGDGETDRAVGQPIRWSYGFQLGGPVSDPSALPRPMGSTSSAQTFGHNGSDTCLAWADPVRQLVFVYLTNLLTARRDGARHLSAVSDALLAACR